MRERLTTGEIPFPRTQLASILDRIEIDEHAIRIEGRKYVLEQSIIAGRRRLVARCSQFCTRLATPAGTART
jgi:hypothetical protein